MQKIIHLLLWLILALSLSSCFGEKHECFFTENINPEYFWSSADCTHGDIYYKSCNKCGTSSNEEYGEYANHDYVDDVCKVCNQDRVSIGLEFECVPGVYDSDEGTYTLISRGYCRDCDIIIPSTYNNLPVTKIAENAFENYTYINSVIIPESIVEIGQRAFYGCTDFKKIIINQGTLTIKSFAFSNCNSLESIILPIRATLPSLHPQNNYYTL